MSRGRVRLIDPDAASTDVTDAGRAALRTFARMLGSPEGRETAARALRDRLAPGDVAQDDATFDEAFDRFLATRVTGEARRPVFMVLPVVDGEADGLPDGVSSALVFEEGGQPMIGISDELGFVQMLMAAQGAMADLLVLDLGRAGFVFEEGADPAAAFFDTWRLGGALGPVELWGIDIGGKVHHALLR